MADRVGQRLGNYQLLQLIGKGGFADVYLGEHIYLKTRAALKVLRIRLNNEALKDFLSEAQTIARLEHPHIIRVLECSVEDDAPFLVMSYAPNGTLRQRYVRGTRPSPGEIISYVQQIASALQYAHEKKFIHRDVKPENMLIGSDNTILLSDFGLVLLAQSTGSQTTKEMAGTIPYMAPEQLHGRPRPASDQYALGIAVYEWLSGERPFQGTFVEIVSQHMLTPPQPLSGRIPGVSPAVENVVFTALAKDPQQRFASVNAFAIALERAYQATSIISSATPIMLPAQDQIDESTFVKPTPDYPSQSTATNTPVLSQSDRSTFIIPPPASTQPSSATVSWNQENQAISSTFVPTPPGSWQQSTLETPVRQQPVSTSSGAFPQQGMPDSARPPLPATITQATTVFVPAAPTRQRRILRGSKVAMLSFVLAIALIATPIIFFTIHNSFGVAVSTPTPALSQSTQISIFSQVSPVASQSASPPTSAQPTATATSLSSQPTPNSPSPTPTSPSPTPTATVLPSQTPSPTFSPTPSPTPSPSPTPPTLTVNPIVLTPGSNCTSFTTTSICRVLLGETANSTGNLNWTSNGGVFSFSPASGTLSPGQTIVVTITAYVCDGIRGLSFSGPANAIHVEYNCQPA